MVVVADNEEGIVSEIDCDCACDCACGCCGRVSRNVRRTSGESSASTCNVRRAAEARRWVGRGREIVL